jgi:hypothetical protein
LFFICVFRGKGTTLFPGLSPEKEALRGMGLLTKGFILNILILQIIKKQRMGKTYEG